MTVALVGFGANLGNPAATCDAVCAELAALHECRDFRASRRMWTAPVGGQPGDPDYLNAVFRMELAQDVDPWRFLDLLLDMERRRGRTRPAHWAPRTLDLDLLLFGEREIRDAPRLVVPHPLLHTRRFVLEPAQDVAPDMRHPGLGLTLRQLWERLAAPQEPRR